jgi:hypothetical protein
MLTGPPFADQLLSFTPQLSIVGFPAMRKTVGKIAIAFLVFPASLSAGFLAFFAIGGGRQTQTGSHHGVCA